MPAFLPCCLWLWLRKEKSGLRSCESKLWIFQEPYNVGIVNSAWMGQAGSIREEKISVHCVFNHTVMRQLGLPTAVPLWMCQ